MEFLKIYVFHTNVIWCWWQYSIFLITQEWKDMLQFGIHIFFIFILLVLLALC
jgi:hypothetical protein